jgi:hypothetical protein
LEPDGLVRTKLPKSEPVAPSEQISEKLLYPRRYPGKNRKNWAVLSEHEWLILGKSHLGCPPIIRGPIMPQSFRVAILGSKYLVSVKFFISLGSDTYLYIVTGDTAQQ